MKTRVIVSDAADAVEAYGDYTRFIRRTREVMEGLISGSS